MGPCVLLSYTSDSCVARICQQGGGGGGQNGNFCTLNSIIIIGVGYVGAFLYSSFLRSTGGMAPPPGAPLSYASEQHATEDLKKKGREKSMHAHHVELHVRPEAARSIQY